MLQFERHIIVNDAVDDVDEQGVALEQGGDGTAVEAGYSNLACRKKLFIFILMELMHIL